MKFNNLDITINRVVLFLLSIRDFALNQKTDGQGCKKQRSYLVSEMASKRARILLGKNV